MSVTKQEENEFFSNSTIESPTVEKNLFSILNMSTKNLLTNNPDQDPRETNENTEFSSFQDSKLRRINRGYSARRYLRSLTKNWDQNLLDSFISDGKLNEDTVYEINKNTHFYNNSNNLNKHFKRKRVEDDLTILPQAYAFDQNWISTTVDMKSYKFVKAQDFNLSKAYQGLLAYYELEFIFCKICLKFKRRKIKFKIRIRVGAISKNETF